MIHTVQHKELPEHPNKVVKHLLIYAVGKLLQHSDQEAVDHIMELLPPVGKRNDEY